MTPYRSKSGKTSGVTAYEIAADRIKVQFNNRDVYTYTYRSAGRETVEEMKLLAQAGKGLSTFISRADPGY